MSNQPLWTVTFDADHKLQDYWQPLYNAGTFVNRGWIASNNGTTTALYLYINLPDDTEITNVTVVGEVHTNDADFYIVAFYSEYYVKGSVLGFKEVTLQDFYAQEQPFNGDVKNAKSILITIPSSKSNTHIDSIIVKGYGIVDPFEAPFSPPIPPVTTPPVGGGALGGLLNILNGANQAFIDEATGADPDLGKLLTTIEQGLGQNLPGVLAALGINVGQYSNLLQSALQALIQDYQLFIKDSNQQTLSLSDAIKDFLTEFNKDLATNLGNITIDGSIGQPFTPEQQKAIMEQASDYNREKFEEKLPDFLKPIGDLIYGLWDIFFGGVLTETNPTNQYLKLRINKIEEIITAVDNGQYNNISSLIHDLFGLDIATTGATKILALAQLAPLVFQLIKDYNQPINTIVQQLVNANITPELYPTEVAITNYFRGQLSYDKFVSELKKYGYSEERIIGILNSRVPELTKNEVSDAFLRKLISEKQHDEILQHLAYDDTTISIIKQLYQYIPSTSDIINMAQRGIFNNVIGTTFNQYADFPVSAKSYFQQQGISDDWQQKLWASHWQLPSYGEANELYHRGQISTAEYNEFLSMLPILPFFRDKLASITYKPLSRLDIRKLIKTGQINKQQAEDSFKAQGYSPNDASLLADYASKYDENGDIDDLTVLRKRIITSIENDYKASKIDRNSAHNALLANGIDDSSANSILGILDSERNLSLVKNGVADYITRAINYVSSGFIKGLIPEASAYSDLIELGLQPSQAKLEIASLQIERIENEKEKAATIIVANYSNGGLTELQFNELLTEYGFSSNEIDYLARQASLKLLDKSKKLTEAQLVKFHKDEIITDDELEEELAMLGYNDRYINWIIVDSGVPKVKK